MASYLDETGFTYFWGKIKDKLSGKADSDKYKIATFTTKKTKNSTPITTNQIGGMFFHDITTNLQEPVPEGYKIALLIGFEYSYYADENAYNNDVKSGLLNITDHIGAITKNGEDTLQKYGALSTVSWTEYGHITAFTVLLEKQ